MIYFYRGPSLPIFKRLPSAVDLTKPEIHIHFIEWVFVWIGQAIFSEVTKIFRNEKTIV